MINITLKVVLASGEANHIKADSCCLVIKGSGSAARERFGWPPYQPELSPITCLNTAVSYEA